MFKMKNFVFALAGACMLSTIAVPMSVSAAAPVAKIIHSTDLLEIPAAGSEKYVYYAVVKSKDSKVAEVKQWEAVPVTGSKGVIDTSFIKDKEAYIMISTDKTEANSGVVTITERQTKLKATFDEKDKIAIVDGKKAAYDTLTIASSGTTGTKTYKWKSGKYGEYQAMAALTTAAIERFRSQGATLYFYETAIDLAGKETRPTKEFAVKIKKSGNAPKVTIDNSKITVKLSEKMEYKLTKDTNWIAGTKDAISLSKIADSTKNDVELTTAVEFEVRTKATEKASASKINVVSVAAQGTKPVKGTGYKLTCTEAVPEVKDADGKVTQAAKPASNKLGVGSDTVEYQLIPAGGIYKVSAKWIKLTKDVEFGSLPKDTKLYVRKMATKGTKETPAVMASQADVLTVNDKNIFPAS